MGLCLDPPLHRTTVQCIVLPLTDLTSRGIISQSCCLTKLINLPSPSLIFADASLLVPALRFVLAASVIDRSNFPACTVISSPYFILYFIKYMYNRSCFSNCSKLKFVFLGIFIFSLVAPVIRSSCTHACTEYTVTYTRTSPSTGYVFLYFGLLCVYSY